VKLTTHLFLMPRLIVLGATPPFPQYFFVAWYLDKHRDNFILYLFYAKAQKCGKLKDIIY
jgi:hypothetical protein